MQPSLRPAILGACALFVADAFLLNQGVLALILGTVFLVGGALSRLFSRDRARGVHKLKRGLVFLAALAAVIGCNRLNNHIARTRAERLVAAVKAYHARHGAYPATLKELVPEFMPGVPRAKYTLMFNEFHYSNREGTAFLWYVDFPPSGRPIYWFQVERWSNLD